ncbi:SDR family oxidoreductase [Thermomicrobium sp. 4228-Ro]|uniref:SDR family oxidoreductase n=1 Tax=Thermomicrobium sp. 4228-Ro TaxID=2993937 RepID=UPI0022490E94|nr:SDR family oxidoreductase [Thermomicrobium sp. 4228-Ro]MCX2728059.1 SDR family oxidoreductase [Thermomicrobium sp. 4228-Ro]
MIGVTGASGRLGRLVITELLQRLPTDQIVALARTPDKIADLAVRGVTVRRAEYDDPATLAPALAGVERLLLVSGSEVGRRIVQHRNVIEAAVRTGVRFIAYTSILHADRTPLRALAEEHVATEEALRASGLAWTFLRHSWYTENYEDRVRAAAATGELVGATGEARISSATRADYAAAAAVVLTTEGHAGRIYELAGDEAWTMNDLARIVGEVTGRPVTYRNLTPEDYKAYLVQQGTPPAVAEVLAVLEAGIAQDALFDDSHQLSQLIGRPTTPLREAVRSWFATR